MAISKIDSDGITAGGITADSLNIGQIGGRRNLIINGDAKINQRGNSTGVTGSAYVGPDRFYILQNNDGSIDVSQNTSGVLADTGHGQSFKIDVNTADASLAAGQYLMMWYLIEAQDCQQLQYGTSNAKSATLSFWIKSNKTGTYNLNLRSYDPNRMLGGSYTIDTADTWEYKTITYIGDTGSAIPNDNGQGLLLDWMFAVGTNFSSGTSPTAWESRTDADRGADTTVNLLDSTANYIEITGVQLEVGSVATPFEHRSYGEELALCQRYYQIYAFSYVNSGYQNGVGQVLTNVHLNTPLRALPSVTYGSANLQASTPQSPDFNPYTISSLGNSQGTITANNTTHPVFFNLSGWSGNDDDACFVWVASELKLDAEL